MTILTRVLRQRRPSSLFVKIFLSYLSIVVILLSILGGLVYITFIRTIKEQTHEFGKLDLYQFTENINDQLRELEITALQVTNNSELSPFFATKDRFGNYEAIGELKKYGYGRGNIADMMLYYYRDRSYAYASSGRYPIETFLNQYQLPADEIEKISNQLTRGQTPIILTSQGQQRISLVYPLPVNSSQPYALLTFVMNQQFWQSAEQIASKYHGNLYIFHNDQLVVHANHSEQGQTIEDAGQLLKLTDSMSRQRIVGTDYSIIRIQSTYNNWNYILAIPTFEYMKQFNNLVAIFNYATLGLFIIGVIIAVTFAVIYNRPLQRLFEKIKGFTVESPKLPVEEPAMTHFDRMSHWLDGVAKENQDLRSELRSKAGLMKQQAVVQLLSGNVKAIETFKQSSEYRLLGFSYSRVTVLLFYIDDYQRFRTQNSPDIQELLKFSILNVLEELANEIGIGYGMNLVEDKGGVMVLNIRDGVTSAELVEFARQAKAFYKKHFRFTLTIGIGSIYDDLAKLPEAFREANKAAQYRFVQGWDQVILYHDVKTYVQDNAESYLYPQSLETKLVHALLQGEVNELEKHMKEMFDFIRLHATSGESGYSLLSSWVITLNRQIEQSMILVDSDRLRLNEMLGERPETLDESERKLTEILLTLCRDIHKRKHEKQDQFIPQIIGYVKHRYTEYSLNLDEIARHFNISPSHITKLFKAETGYTLMNYVDKLRMERAKELLKATDEPLRTVLQSTGYLDETNFIRKFKKAEGITPMQYRALIRGQQSDR
ncbi:helix-turn-helix domain-containing protein [Paenibacillus sp. strain BS8-2]